MKKQRVSFRVFIIALVKGLAILFSLFLGVAGFAFLVYGLIFLHEDFGSVLRNIALNEGFAIKGFFLMVTGYFLYQIFEMFPDTPKEEKRKTVA